MNWIDLENLSLDAKKYVVKELQRLIQQEEQDCCSIPNNCDRD